MIRPEDRKKTCSQNSLWQGSPISWSCALTCQAFHSRQEHTFYWPSGLNCKLIYWFHDTPHHHSLTKRFSSDHMHVAPLTTSASWFVSSVINTWHVRCTHAEQEIFTWTDESEKGRSLTSTLSVIAAWLLISGLKKLDLQKIHTDGVIPKACPLYILADPVFLLLALIQHDGLRFLQIGFLHLTLMAWNPSLSHEQVSALYREPWWSHPHTPEHIYTRIFLFHKWSLLDDSLNKTRCLSKSSL